MHLVRPVKKIFPHVEDVILIWITLMLNVTKNRQLTQIDSSRRFYSSYAKYTK